MEEAAAAMEVARKREGRRGERGKRREGSDPVVVRAEAAPVVEERSNGSG